MASVHLSISKHSQLSSLSTGGEVISFFFSPLHHCPFPFSSLFQLFLQSYLSTLHLSLSTRFPPLAFYIFFAASSCFSFPPYSSPHRRHLPLLPVVSCDLSRTAHSATKRSCLQHYTLANQAKPECSSRSTQRHHETGQLWDTGGGKEGGERFVSLA